MNDMFIKAAAQKLRFSTTRGEVTVEQLFDMPLTSSTTFDLDTVAQGINRALKAQDEESFVNRGTNPVKAKLELQLDIVKYVINYKQEAFAAARKAADRKAERTRLMEIMASKQDLALQGMSIEDLQKRIDALAD